MELEKSSLANKAQSMRNQMLLDFGNNSRKTKSYNEVIAKCEMVVKMNGTLEGADNLEVPIISFEELYLEIGF